MKKYILLLVVILSSCSNWQWDKSGSTSVKKMRQLASVGQKYDVAEIVDELYNAVNKPIGDTMECSQEAGEYYKLLFSLEAKDINIEVLNKESIDSVVAKSFEIRSILKERLKGFKVDFIMHQDCLSQVRNIYRALRYFEDYMIGFREIEEKELSLFQGSAPFFQVGKNYQEFRGADDLKSGDILVSRGNGYISAAIARVGIDDSQFSHLSLVYRDEETNELFTVEAHIEIGAVVAPFQKHIDQKNTRTVVYRMKDSELAHKAAKYMYEKVKIQSETGKNIPYDFKMNYNDPSGLFCSEVGYEAYLNASKGVIRIPKFKTRFNLGISPFLGILGIDLNEQNQFHVDTFGPGDIEFDDRFDLVAEWRNPHELEDSRIKDGVLTSIFKWMNDYDYRIHSSLKYSAIAYSAWVGRRVPIVQQYLKAKMPLNMTAKQLNTFIVLEDKIGKMLKEKVDTVQKSKKYPLTFREMYEVLEDFRLTDLENYKIVHYNSMKSKSHPVTLHKFLRPPAKKIFKK